VKTCEDTREDTVKIIDVSGPKWLSMYQVRSVTYVSGLDLGNLVGLGGFEPPT